jgi:lactate dehydrogenase-like 2-hydroxyacid dehydrogenase
MAYSNKIDSGHQAYLTEEALKSIAETTVKNLKDMEATGTCANLVK